MAVQTATTKSYQVQYVNLNSLAAIADLTTAMLSINYNIDMNARRLPGPVDQLTFQISKNGNNVVVTTLGRYVVYDNGVLSEMDQATFLARYTP
jgi:hypothetical protein